MQKVMAYLWYDKDAEAAMKFYVEVFNGSPFKQVESKIVTLEHWSEGPLDGPLAGLEGKVSNGVFELAGQRFAAFDGGPSFKFTEAISLYVDCDSQEEVDYFWNKLTAVPESEACGWLKDKFGLSWQIVPKALGEMLSDSDSEKSGRALQAMMKMKKLNIEELRRAFNGESE